MNAQIIRQRFHEIITTTEKLPGAIGITGKKEKANKTVLLNQQQAIAPLPPVSDVLVNNNAGALPLSGFTQSGTSIVAFGNNVVVAFNDAGPLAMGQNKVSGFAYSLDGGVSFTDGGTLPASFMGDGGYPVLARNNTSGRIYLATLGFTTSVLQVFKSDDNGVTWSAPVVGSPGGSIEDKHWITVDNYPGAGNGNVYIASRSFAAGSGLHLYKSVDHGNSFFPNAGILLSVTPSAQGANVVVGPDHSVYVFWYETGFIRMRKSMDFGATFGPPVTVALGLVGGVNGDLGLTGIRNGTVTPAPFRTSEFPHAAVNPVSGHIYVTYGNDGAGTDKADVFITSSSNGGATWAAPVKVNDDATTTDQWQPTVAVMPDGLNMGVFYYSRQEDPANNLYKYYSRMASISGTLINFGVSIPVSGVASLPEFGRDAVINSVFMGQSDQVATTAEGFFVSWADNRSDYLAGLPRKDPNVYFSKFGTTGPSPIPSLTLFATALSGGNGNGTLDANEVNNLTVTLKNLGGATATGISAELSSSSPGIVVTQNTSAYNDLGTGISDDNLSAFVITTNSEYTCGGADFILTVDYDGGSQVFNFSLPTGGILGQALSFHNNTVTAITDLTTIDIPIQVSGFTGSIGKASLSLHLTHTFDADLNINLISPDGVSVELSSGNGGTGDNYGVSCNLRTIFDDGGPSFINSGVAPFAGTFKPEISLSILNGKSGTAVNGTWILRIRDIATQDVGSFQCATLSLAPSVCSAPIIAAGSTIISESCTAANASIDPGETVTVSLCLQNVDATDATDNLVATLQNTGGVTNASGAQTFGELLPGGVPVCRNFTFTADGNCGGTITATLQLQDGTTDYGTVTYTFTLGGADVESQTFSNNTDITIPVLGSGNIYPSIISVAGLSGALSKITVTLTGLSHTFPADVDMLLVSPAGQKMILLSDAIGGADWVNTNYILDDDAIELVGATGVPQSGTFKPTNYVSGDLFAAPAPAGPYESPSSSGTATLASVFTGNPNGNWSLYIVDDSGFDEGSLSGWSLTISTATSSCCSETTCTITCPADISVPNDPGVCGAIVNFDPPEVTGTCGVVTTVPASGSLFPFGTTTVTATSTSGSTCTFNVTVTPLTALDCSITGSTSICNVETTEWCAPENMSDYEWTGPAGFKAFTRCITIGDPGIYLLSYTDGNGCRKECNSELTVQSCAVACTYSQGFYGNKKGIACYTHNGVSSSISTTQLMLNAFDITTSKVFGNVANNQFFTLYRTDITNGNIFKMLPGVGNSSVLGVDNTAPLDGAYYADQNTWSLVPIPKTGSQKGRINNMLLSQLITLWFNIRTSASLGIIPLTEDTLVTKAQSECGSGIPSGAEQKFGLPHEVVVYLNDAANGYSSNINGLYDLANDVLGGANDDLSAAVVQNAIAVINNAFDKCRVLTGTLPYIAPLEVARIQRPGSQENIVSGFTVSAYPNPAKTAFKLLVKSKQEGKISIRVTNLLGQLVETRTIMSNQLIQIGESYKTGTYFIEVRQGLERRQLKLIKLE